MRINSHAGHNPDGKVACGAVGLVKESTKAREINAEFMAIERREGHTVYDCTVNNGSSQSDVINKIVNLTKRNKVDLDVSIHLNSGADDEKGNGRTTGVEVLVYDTSGPAYEAAHRICKEIEKLGFRNRGVKIRRDLGVLSRTLAPALLVECCFVDDYDDVKLLNVKAIAKAIAVGINGKPLKVNEPVKPPTTTGKYANGDYNRKARVARTNGTGLNVRKARNTNEKPITNLKEGTVLTVNYCLNNWFSTYDYKVGNNPTYVCGDYLELI